MRTITEIQQSLPTSIENGLTSEGVAQSRERSGVNRLTPLPRDPIWKKFLEKFDEPIIKILLGAALLSMVVGLFHASYTLGGVAMGLVVVALATAVLLRLMEWVPSLLFGSAVVIFFIGVFSAHRP